MVRFISHLIMTLLSLLLLASSVVESRESKVNRLLAHHVDMSMPMPGKGKGKGSSTSTSSKGKGKGGSSEDYMSMPMSMDMSMSVKGKGKGKGGTSKSSKSSKSSKKSSKKGKGDNGGGGEPTTAPVATPITPSPTSENSIPIRATPFALFYDGSFSRIPSDDEFASVAELTRVYLEEFMNDEFAQTSLTNLDDFLTFMIRNQFVSGQPVQADYRCTGLFNPSSIFLPTVRELNSLIDEAFTDDKLVEYISRIQGLPSGNVFSTTTSVMKGLPSTPVPRIASSDSSESASSMKMGLAAAAASIVVLAAGAAMMKRQGSDDDSSLDDPYGDNLKGDSATLAGETCNTSIDGSAAWRNSSPYARSHDLDESEFEDEPLDSDDDGESSKQFHRVSSRRSPYAS